MSGGPGQFNADARITEAIRDFARQVRLDRRANPRAGGDGSAPELALAPRFKSFVEAVSGAAPPDGVEEAPDDERDSTD